MPIRLTVAILAITPGLFRLRYFLRKDKFKPEPKKLIIKMFIRWAIAVIPAALIEVGIESIIPIEFFWLVIVAPIVEELIKYLTMKRGITKHKHFDEPIDAMIYAVAVALGFATFENVSYIRDAYQSGMLEIVAGMRALISVPWHAIFASMRGYAVGVVHFSKAKINKKKIIFAWLSLAMLLHACLNFLSMINLRWALGMVVLMIVMWILFHKKLKKLMIKK